MTVTDHVWLDSIHSLLEQALDGSQDPALMSRMLTPPDFSIISQERATINPDHIHLVSEKIKNDVLNSCSPLLHELYFKLNVTKDYKPDAQSMAERALKSTVLSYLTCRADADAAKLAKEHYDCSTNMTDRMMALGALANSNSVEHETALEDFYDRYTDQENVINKWFRVQAMAIRPQTIDDVRRLSEQHDFVMTNPNRVRALFGTLSLRNPIAFHRADGDGYELFGEFISRLDPINPQTAARLLTALESWRRYDPARQDKIRAVLEKILEQRNLSPNCYEITSKMLGA